MANNTEDAELQEKLQKIAGRLPTDDWYQSGWDSFTVGVQALIQQEANRQKIELLDMLEKSMPTPKSLSNYTLNMGAAHNPPPDTTRTNLQRIGYNSACTKSLEAIEAVRKQLEGGE